VNGVFVELYPVWRNHNRSKGVKIRIVNTNVKPLLLYACETWKTTSHIIRKVQIFVNKCLRRTMKIKCTDKTTNEELWRITQQNSTENQTKRRKWNWIRHTLRKETGAVEKTALDRSPQGYRRRGRPKRTWRRTIEDEIRGTEDHGMRSRVQLEIAKPVNSSRMPYAPHGITGLDDDDDDDDPVLETARRVRCSTQWRILLTLIHKISLFNSAVKPR
jgi:hypothetical protein